MISKHLLPSANFKAFVRMLIFCAICFSSCTPKMYIAHVTVVPAPGGILKDVSTIKNGMSAILRGAIYSDYGQWVVSGAGVHVINLDSLDVKLVTSTGPGGEFEFQTQAGRFSLIINHLDYNRFGPMIIELKPGEHREIHIDLNKASSYVKVDTIRSKKRLSLDVIRRQVIEKDARLQTVHRDSISIRLVKTGAKD